MIVFIIGFMGSGKTSVGKRLAGKMGYSFTDLDMMIESKTGMSVTSIFQQKGEAYFREIEAGCLRETVKQQNAIIACGGGTPCFGDNMKFMNDNGFTIYLKMTPAALKSRLETTENKRPLVEGMEGNALQEYIEKTLDNRRIWYEGAHLITDGLDIDVEELKSIILNLGSDIL